MHESRFWYDPVANLAHVLLWVTGRISVTGRENVPKSGPLLLVSNHLSHLDPPALAWAFPRYIHFMAKEELFEPRLLGWYLRRIGTFPIKRGTADRNALRTAFAILEEGQVLAMFPEGKRSETGRLQEPEEGAGLIALRSKAPIVPMSITGTHRILPAHSARLHFGKSRVLIGKPFTLDDLYDQRGREAITEATRRIMASIAALLPEEYQSEPRCAPAAPSKRYPRETPPPESLARESRSPRG